MADEDFPTFELIPGGTDDFPPDEELASFEDPDAIPSLDAEPDVLPTGYTWQLNPETGQFARTPLRVEGTDAVVAVAQVAVRTARYRHPSLFPDDFGRENMYAGIGRVDDAESRAERERDLRETLLACHERITAVTNFLFFKDPDEEIAVTECDIEIDGDTVVRLEGVPV